jgi:hypothetical protein
MQLHQAVAAGYLPVRRSVTKDAAFATPQNRAFGLTDIPRRRGAAPAELPLAENSDALNDALGRMVQQVISNRMPVREAMAWASGPTTSCDADDRASGAPRGAPPAVAPSPR